jgi:hypothetical protein
MDTPIIQRYISNDDDFKKIICCDFEFLVEKIKKFGFEYSLEIRKNYFNLYYQGNSIGKIKYVRPEKYEISIHEKFLNCKIRKQFRGKNKNRYIYFIVKGNKLPSFFSDTSLKSMSQKVKEVNYQEETAFEQMLMTDNIGREDFIIIDRQVADHTSTKKMDLLALKKITDDDFQFCILEVKLGNNPELKKDVITQLDHYIKRIEDNFDDYKNCYEKNFQQKKLLGLIEIPATIKIIKPVIGIVVVGGYGGIAKKSIAELKNNRQNVKLIHIQNKIDFNQII